ncbi:MAG: NAD(P)-dependent oxidoreductase, partial [Alphaproteobacteria bacterium]|nr:NAD(P)-dependent oxidoreductase [Alphaproteobacteria bacterium]
MKVLLTGAAGTIGRVLRQGLSGQYDLLRLADISPLSDAGPGEECIEMDIGDLDAAVSACRGIDCVVHLAAIPVEPEDNAWAQILPANIAGTYNVFEAARQAGAKRVVFASSNHVVGFYRRDAVADPDAAMRPDSVYGVSKVFGEALGRLYADKHGMSVACLRIGSFRERPEDRRQIATWISHRDGVQLFRR